MNAPLNRLEELYRAHARELKTYARRRVGMQEAEDVVHDVYLNLLQKRSAATFAHPKAYLFRVARNAAVDALRKKLTRARHVAQSIRWQTRSLATAQCSRQALWEADIRLRVETKFAQCHHDLL